MITAKLTLKVQYIGMFSRSKYIETWLSSCEKKIHDPKRITCIVRIKDEHFFNVKKYATAVEIISDDSSSTKVEILELKDRIKELEKLL